LQILSTRSIIYEQFFTTGKIFIGMGRRYLNALKKHEAVIAKNVTENLFERT